MQITRVETGVAELLPPVAEEAGEPEAPFAWALDQALEEEVEEEVDPEDAGGLPFEPLPGEDFEEAVTAQVANRLTLPAAPVVPVDRPAPEGLGLAGPRALPTPMLPVVEPRNPRASVDSELRGSRMTVESAEEGAIEGRVARPDGVPMQQQEGHARTEAIRLEDTRSLRPERSDRSTEPSAARSDVERAVTSLRVPAELAATRSRSSGLDTTSAPAAVSVRAAAVTSEATAPLAREELRVADDRAAPSLARSSGDAAADERFGPAARELSASERPASASLERDVVRAQPRSTPVAPAAAGAEIGGWAPAASGGVAAVAAPMAPSSAAPQPVDAIPQHIELLASRGGGTARLRLDPPQLGHIDIRVAMRGSTVDVVIQADEPAAQAAVLAHSDQLTDALANRELRIDRFDVLSGPRGERGDDAPGEQRAFGDNPGSDHGSRQASGLRLEPERAGGPSSASGVPRPLQPGVGSGDAIHLRA